MITQKEVNVKIRSIIQYFDGIESLAVSDYDGNLCLDIMKECDAGRIAAYKVLGEIMDGIAENEMHTITRHLYPLSGCMKQSYQFTVVAKTRPPDGGRCALITTGDVIEVTQAEWDRLDVPIVAHDSAFSAQLKLCYGGNT